MEWIASQIQSGRPPSQKVRQRRMRPIAQVLVLQRPRSDLLTRLFKGGDAHDKNTADIRFIGALAVDAIERAAAFGGQRVEVIQNPCRGKSRRVWPDSGPG